MNAINEKTINGFKAVLKDGTVVDIKLNIEGKNIFIEDDNGNKFSLKDYIDNNSSIFWEEIK